VKRLNLFFKGSLSFLGVACALTLVPLTARSTEQPAYETEAQRLERVRTIISQEKSRRLKGYQYRQENSTAPSCEVMLDDLLNNRGFEPVEPVAVLNHNYPLRSPFLEEKLSPEEEQQAQAAEDKMRPFLTKSLQQCAKAEADGDERRARALFNAFNYAAGVPPFRVYLLPEKINPFPDSNLMYWSEYAKKTGKGGEGYSWVNLKDCEHTWGVRDLSSLGVKSDPKGQVAALTNYRDKLVVWVVSRGFRFEAQHYEPNYQDKVKAGTTCAWTTYPEEPKKIVEQ
jgi:hypothetical protein